MITRRTKIQLLVFVSSPWSAFLRRRPLRPARPAVLRLDATRWSRTSRLRRHLRRSRGHLPRCRLGQVDDIKLTEDGVDVDLGIDKVDDKIPADALAVVGNRSAVGEQYVELQPQSDNGPYLRDGSEIAGGHGTPVPTDRAAHQPRPLVPRWTRTICARWSTSSARPSTGPARDLGQIIDTTNSFIETANANFDVTTALIRDSNTVLRTQLDKGSSIRSFSRDLALFSGPARGQGQGPAHADRQRLGDRNELRTFIEENEVDLAAADQQPGHHRRDHGQAPAGHPADPGALPVRRRRWLHGGQENPSTATTPASASS